MDVRGGPGKNTALAVRIEELREIDSGILARCGEVATKLA
jgi:hypothetical protein